jgi:hypothetical protein
MKKMGLLMIGCAGIVAAPGCVADPAEADVDQTQVAEAELAVSPPAPGPHTIGAFHRIRLSNTNLCLQPLGGTTADSALELRTCNDTETQHWFLSNVSSVEWEILNLHSGRCVYENTSSPVGGAEQIIHADCNIAGTNTPASNALWRPTALTGNARIQSRVGHRDTGFCIHVPGIPFDGIGVVNERCEAGNPAQIFVIGTE